MDSTAKAEWRQGWPLVLASFSGISTVTLVSYLSGLVISPIEQEFGWSRTEITSGLMIHSAVGVVFAPFVGLLIDRIGPRRLGVPGILIFCLALASLGTVTDSIWHWWALWLGIAIGAMMLTPTVWTTAISSRFDHARGTALAVTLLGTGLTGVIALPLGGLLLDQYGWRIGLPAMALIWGLVAFPACFFFFYGAKDIVRTGSASKAATPIELTGMEAREAFLSWKYLRLALSIALVMPVISGVLVHLVPFFIGAGMDPLVAATLASIIGIANMAGRLVTGFLLDRFNGAVVGSVAFALPAVLLIVLLNFDGSITMAVLAATFLGLSAGAELDVAAYLTSRHFGIKSYGFLFGVIAGILSLTMGVGPMIMARVYDSTGSYDLAFLISLPAVALASILVGSLGREDPRFAVKH